MEQLRETAPQATALDALLDLSRFNWRPVRRAPAPNTAPIPPEKVEWASEPRPGWIVPIPVGFGALSELLPAGEVQNARDHDTAFRFVESLYSIGQWISPHRLKSPGDLLWHPVHDTQSGMYRCVNAYARTHAPATPLAPL